MAELTPTSLLSDGGLTGAGSKILILEAAITSSEDVITINASDYDITSVTAVSAVISSGGDADLAFIKADASGNAIRVYTYEDDGSTAASDFTNASGVFTVYCSL